MIYKKGFNLIKTFPINFSEDIVTIRHSGPAESFRFSFPDKKAENIIISFCTTEPWALPHRFILKDHPIQFLHKLEKVRREYFPDSQCRIVVGRREDKLINELISYGKKKEWFHTYSMKPIYPFDAPVMIIKNVLNTKIAFDEDPIDHGILLIEPQTVDEIHEHYLLKRESGARFIPISGTGLSENMVLKVKPGTPFEDVLKKYTRPEIKYRVFLNGPLNGTEIKDLTQKVSWTLKSIVVMEEKDYKIPFPFVRSDELRFTTNLMGELRRCIYCNHCDDICPVNLEPALYWHCYSRGEKRLARAYALDKCIECGLCSFICPSKLELLKVIRECKP